MLKLAYYEILILLKFQIVLSPVTLAFEKARFTHPKVMADGATVHLKLFRDLTLVESALFQSMYFVPHDAFS